jgi:membrane associated rhomboid family serine protease
MKKFFARYGLTLVFQILLIMFLVQVVNELTGGRLRVFGIHPRDWTSLPLIFTAPFIHGNWLHLANNAVGFLIFSSLCLVRGKRFYCQTSLLIVTLGGLLVWILGRPAVHIGASGWIFGLWSLSITLAWFERSLVNFLISCTVVVLYGGMVLGVLPNHPGVSFEGHAFGALAGIVAAALYGRRYRTWRWR